MADNNLDKKEKGKVDFDVIKAKVKNPQTFQRILHWSCYFFVPGNPIL